MRVLELTESTANRFLASRSASRQQAERVARRIVEDVRRRGDRALFEWTERLDQRALTPRSVWISRAELAEARQGVSRDFRRAIRHAARNIRRVARRQLPRAWTIEVEPGVRAGQRVRPIELIGCYLPGGRFSLVSTLLMTVVPAQVAGVRRVVVVSPRPGAQLLAAADLLGVTSVARIGGAQAIAALAYGTRSIPRVDKICGPGNRYVAAAKQIVSVDCAIDLPAGPTEAVVLASRGRAPFMAADLIAQAEHDPDAVSLLITTSSRLARDVAGEIERQLAALPATNLARRSLARHGAVLVARTPAAALDFVNRFAPEHLSLPEGERGIWKRFDAAGSVFLGDWSAQTFGDYASGTNHVLPTGGAGRARGGLSAADFVKCISVQQVSRSGVRRLGPVAEELARAEGLLAHARAVEVRR